MFPAMDIEKDKEIELRIRLSDSFYMLYGVEK
jgi:hypothetical protein